jgi:hypothetical protein
MIRIQLCAVLMVMAFATVTIAAPADPQSVRGTSGKAITPAPVKKGTADPNAIATEISRDPQQRAHVEAMLPRGMTLEQATAGFRNQWQFIAALNASQNHKIPFNKLHTALMVDGLSLGQAVQQLKGAGLNARLN